MRKSAFRPRGARMAGFTLLEVAMAGVSGSVLLVGLAYSSMEMNKAMTGVLYETTLQNIARDVQLSLDSSLNAVNRSGLPAHMTVTSGGMDMGTMRLRFNPAGANAAEPGGDFAWSNDAGAHWHSMADIGSRGMFDDVEFAYGKFVTEEDDDLPTPDRMTYVLDDRVRGRLMRVTSRLKKYDMVPMNLQMASAPRALTWSWVDNSVAATPGADSDGDGVTDDKDDMPLDPTAAFRERYPAGSAETASIAFEDLYPNLGDADYNDLVAAFFMKETWGPGVKDDPAPARRPALKEVYMRFFAQARGAGYNHEMRINLRDLVTGGGRVTVLRYDPTGRLDSQETFTTASRPDVVIFPDTRTQLPPSSDGWSTNARPGTTIRQSWTTVVRVEFDQPDLNRYDLTQPPPYDPYLRVKDTNQEIHLPLLDADNNGSPESYRFADGTVRRVIDARGDAWALLVPTNFAWPLERQLIDTAYPRYRPWVQAGRPALSDWYYYPLQARYKNAALNPGGTAAPSPHPDWFSLNDADQSGNARYVYVFDPKLFTNGEGAFLAPTTSSVAAAAVGVISTPAPTPTPAPGGNAESLDLHPIALHASLVANKRRGDSLGDIDAGNQVGRFGWLAWDGDTSADRLARSLAYPGDSVSYVNPDNNADRVINVGDTIRGNTEFANTGDLRRALKKLQDYQIVVPLWDTSTGTNANVRYHVSGFAKIKLTEARLRDDPDEIGAKFIALTDSRGNPPGTVYAAATPTPTPVPTATPTATPTPAPASDDLHPIALHQSVIAGRVAGATLTNVLCGNGSGNFGWLSWDGDGSAPRLATSLAVPGDSGTFTNPYDANDHQIDAGDWIWGNTGISNSSAVRTRLDYMIANNVMINVPVWDTATGSGANARYHTVAFARLRLTAYHLPGTNSISAVYQGLCTNEGVPIAAATPTPGPTATPAATPTPTPTPVATPTPTPTPVAADATRIMPIALGASAVQGRSANTDLGYLSAGTGSGAFAWVNWSGGTSQSELLASLALPGNANTYVNPTNGADHHLDVGDLLGVVTDDLSNTSGNRNAIDGMTATQVTVPLFDSVVGGRLRVSGFARVTVDNRQINQSPDRLRLTFVRYCDSAGN